MPEFPPTSNQFSTSFDPSEIEARLNALVGNNAQVTEEDQESEPDLMQQFLADESLNYLEERSTYRTDEGEHQTVVQLYRVDVLPNQSRIVIHSSFSPDLAKTPSIEAMSINRDARIRVTHSAIFGARLEINLTTPEPLPSQCCLEVISTTTPDN